MGKWGALAVVVLAFTCGVATAALKPWPYAVIVGALKPAKPDVNYAHRTSLFEVLRPEASTVMLGDSLTSQGEWGELVPGAINRGIPGDTVDGVRRRLTRSLPANARRVFLMVGVNDFRRGADVESVATNYEALIRTLPTKPYVQSTLYTQDEVVNRKVAALNAKLIAICRTGACTFLDLNATLAPQGRLPDAYTADGVHLTGAAYQAWASEIRRLH